MGLLKKIIDAFWPEPALKLEVVDKSGAFGASEPETSPPKIHPSANIKVDFRYLEFNEGACVF